ncbi:type II toxin-antitoxin system death-on-curing family toxin [Microbispora sp. NBC_01189]|uniref:type II toxin-antitoxin system death-on-curing family toxin n=1 Tax=Microbispora sp. NBC_01189 TaxID=2903583 RepID=UPI002E1556DF|nr:type II toxin-antitoxin system death-on-curing family toxin [Microbispora sp. NBC_01189]
MFGRDAYPDLFTKAAAILHSIVSNHPFVDGIERAACLTMYVFWAKDGLEIDPQDDDAAYEFVIAVASRKLAEVDEVASVLRGFIAS